MLTLEYAQALPGILVNAAWPGYTATDLNDHEGTQTVTEGTEPIVRLATLPPGGPSGTPGDGRPVPENVPEGGVVGRHRGSARSVDPGPSDRDLAEVTSSRRTRMRTSS